MNRAIIARVALAALAGMVVGCERPERPNLIVLTGWPASQRSAFEAEVRSWPVPPTYRWRWIGIEPGESRISLARKAAGADVALGLPAAMVEQMQRAGSLAPDRAWSVVGRSALGFSSRLDELDGPPPATWGDLGSSAFRGRLVLDSPKSDWTAFLSMKSALRGPDWSAGYASLVLAVANARRVGPYTGPVGPSAGVEGPAGDRVVFRASEPRSDLVEAVALLRDAPHPAEAESLLRHLSDQGRATPPEVSDLAREPGGLDPLLADLLQSAFVDAQDELWTAAEALSRLESPDRRDRLTRFLTQPPPWPPASILKIRGRPSPEPLLETLAREVTSDPTSREWLLARWREPERPIDGDWLAKLAEAEEGRLVRDPRFRAWLRAEWTAWARQRYRRVARATSGAFSP